MENTPPLLAELYDLDTRGFEEDIPFYHRLALETGGPVLDLGVGTGRAALPLARAGLEVWGLDTSPAMLEAARRKAGPERDQRLHLVQADMRDFELDRQFGLVFAGFGAFHHLLTPGDQLACLRCVERHLASGGRFAFDLRPWHTADWQAGDSVPLLHEWTAARPATGETVMKFAAVRPEPERQLQHEDHIYDVVSGDGTVRRLMRTVDLRFSTVEELAALLHEAGLVPGGLYGDYGRGPYNEASEYLIVVARRAEVA